MNNMQKIFDENYKIRETYFHYIDINRETVYIMNTRLAKHAEHMYNIYSSLLVPEIISNELLFEMDDMVLLMLKRCKYDEELCLLEHNLRNDIYDMIKICENAEEYEMCENIFIFINKLFIEENI